MLQTPVANMSWWDRITKRLQSVSTIDVYNFN